MAAHAIHSTGTHHNDNSSEAHIGSIAVHTDATDAHGIAADIGPALQRGQRTAKANHGMASVLASVLACALIVVPEVARSVA